MIRALFVKEVRLMKKNYMLNIGLILVMALFMHGRTDKETDTGAVPLLIMVSILGLIFLRSLYMAEEKYPGGAVMLLCTPCPKKFLVAVRYFVMGLFFSLCAAGYEVVGLLMGGKILLTWQIMQAFAVYSLLMGIFIPVVYKVGITKVEYLLSGTIMVVGLCSSAFTNSAYFKAMTEILNRNQNLAAVCFAAFCMVFTWVSYWTALKVYEKKECPQI